MGTAPDHRVYEQRGGDEANHIDIDTLSSRAQLNYF